MTTVIWHCYDVFKPNSIASSTVRCSEALGMESASIKNDNIRASSTYGDNFETYGPHRARLNQNSSGYRAEPPVNNTAENEPWLVIELENKTVITGIATQGFGGASEWVTNYTLMFSAGEDYKNFKEINGDVQVREGCFLI